MKTSRWIVASVTLVSFLAVGSRALAAQAAPSSPMDTALAAVEAGLGQIETSGKITEAIDLDAALDRYQGEAQKSYESTFQAVKDDAAKAAAAHQPGTSAANRLQAWERTLTSHRARMEKVISRLTAINMKVRDGSILFAPDLVKKLPKEELDELRQWLTPDAIRKYQALDKSLFAAGPGAAWVPDTVLAQELSLPAGCPACRPRSRSPLTLLDDLLAPDAEAAIAAGCVTVCGATPEACVPCLIVAGEGANQLVKLLQDGLKLCDSTRHTRIGRALCKAGIVLGFIATIA
jgi:hypothetical protein